jgi:hypothetical protein
MLFSCWLFFVKIKPISRSTVMYKAIPLSPTNKIKTLTINNLTGETPLRLEIRQETVLTQNKQDKTYLNNRVVQKKDKIIRKKSNQNKIITILPKNLGNRVMSIRDICHLKVHTLFLLKKRQIMLTIVSWIAESTKMMNNSKSNAVDTLINSSKALFCQLEVSRKSHHMSVKDLQTAIFTKDNKGVLEDVWTTRQCW